MLIRVLFCGVHIIIISNATRMNDDCFPLLGTEVKSTNIIGEGNKYNEDARQQSAIIACVHRPEVAQYARYIQ